MTPGNTGGLRFGRIAATLPVTDIKLAMDLYCGLFGFEITYENGDPVGFLVLEKDSAELHLTLQKSYKAPKFNVAHMLVSDAAGLLNLCKGHGLRIVKGLQDKDYDLRAFVFEDPFGNRIDVGEPIPARTD